MTFPEISNFGDLPFGEESRGIPVLSTYPNNAIWVDTQSGSDLPQMGSFSNPFKSFSYALTQVAEGDMIIFKAGNTVSLSAKLTVSINNLIIYTPFSPLTFNFTGTGGQLAVSGNGVKFIGQPIVLVPTVANVATGIKITGNSVEGSFLARETTGGSFSVSVIDIQADDSNIDLEYTTEDEIISTLATVVVVDGARPVVNVQAKAAYATEALVTVPVTGSTTEAKIQVIGNNARTIDLGSIFEDKSGTATYSVSGYNTVLCTGFKGSNTTGLQYDTYLKTDFRAGVVTSDTIPNNTNTLSVFQAPVDTVVTDITLQTAAVGLAGPTNIVLATDTPRGVLTLATIAIADLGANKTVSVKDLSPEYFPMLLTTNNSIFVKGDDGVGTGAGTVSALVMYSYQQTSAISAANV